MIEYLRNQERLSPEEESRIDRAIRTGILIAMAAVIGIILWAALRHRTFGKLYYAVIIILLAAVWAIKYVLGGILKHSLAQRTDEEVSAYLKAAGLELCAYAGLGWFLLAMQGSSIIGAVIYMIGVTAARKQKDIYDGVTKDTEASSDAGTDAEEEADAPVPGADESTGADTRALPDSHPSDDDSQTSLGSLPSAADRQMREEKESGDGSV